MAYLSPKHAIIKRLLDHASITAIVGTKIYPDHAVPQKIGVPFISVGLRESQHIVNMAGYSGFAQTSIVVDVLAVSDAQCDTLAELIRNRLLWVTSLTITNGSDSCSARSCRVINDESDFAPPQDGSDQPIRLRRIEIELFHSEPTS